MDPFANSQEYAARTNQPLSEQQQLQVSALLGDASALMRKHAPGLDARVTAGAVERALVVGTCVRVVERYLANPSLAAQVTVGPFSRAWAAANARGLFLTADELADLGPTLSAGRAAGVGTIRLGLAVGPARGPC